MTDAHNIVRFYLEDDAIRNELLMDENLKELLYENTTHKAHYRQYDLITAQELKLFKEGPVKTYLETQERPLEDPRIELALFNIIQNEKGATTPIRDFVRSKMVEKSGNDDAFDTWVAIMAAFIAVQPSFEVH